MLLRTGLAMLALTLGRAGVRGEAVLVLLSEPWTCAKDARTETLEEKLENKGHQVFFDASDWLREAQADDGVVAVYVPSTIGAFEDCIENGQKWACLDDAVAEEEVDKAVAPLVHIADVCRSRTTRVNVVVATAGLRAPMMSELKLRQAHRLLEEAFQEELERVRRACSGRLHVREAHVPTLALGTFQDAETACPYKSKMHDLAFVTVESGLREARSA